MQLYELKEKFEKCRRTAGLLEYREQIMGKIDLLKRKIEGDLLKAHHERDQEVQAHLQQGIEQDREHLDVLLKDLRAVDHDLDETDHVDAEMIRTELINRILEEHSQSKGEYLAINSKLRSASEEIRVLSAEQAILAPFTKALAEGDRARFRRGFWNTLFGRNSKIILARAIQNALVAGEKALDQLEDSDCRAHVENFIAEARKSWNRPLYRDRYFELYDAYLELMEEREGRLGQLRRVVASAEESLDRWIDSHCPTPRA